MKKTKIRLFIGLISFVLYSFFIYAPIFPSISNNLWDELFTGTKPSLEKLINDYDKNPSKEYQKSDILKIIGIAWHNLGHLGQTGAGEKSFKYLEKASKLMSDDMEILAYMGSAETLKARDDWFPISKLMGVNSGASKIDKAIENDPDNVIVRLVRANNSLALPSFF
ncbi:MAG: hypothetical protein GY730_09800 [bacterium]|nr:hypothetical protein [bacterium]